MQREDLGIAFPKGQIAFLGLCGIICFAQGWPRPTRTWARFNHSDDQHAGGAKMASSPHLGTKYARYAIPTSITATRITVAFNRSARQITATAPGAHAGAQ